MLTHTMTSNCYWNPASLKHIQCTDMTRAMKMSMHRHDKALWFVHFHRFNGLKSALVFWTKQKQSQGTVAIRMQHISHAGSPPGLDLARRVLAPRQPWQSFGGGTPSATAVLNSGYPNIKGWFPQTSPRPQLWLAVAIQEAYRRHEVDIFLLVLPHLQQRAACTPFVLPYVLHQLTFPLGV